MDGKLKVSAYRAGNSKVQHWKYYLILPITRLGRLRIKIACGVPVSVMTFNVHTFSVDRRLCDCTLVGVDDSPVLVLSQADVTRFTTVGQKIWEVNISDCCVGIVSHNVYQVVSDEHKEIQPPSRLQQILSSRNHMVFIVPDVPQSRELSVALRIAHDLNVHHRLDAEILLESEVLPLLGLDSWSESNIVFIGKPSSTLVQQVLGDKKTPFEARVSGLGLNNQALNNDCCM